MVGLLGAVGALVAGANAQATSQPASPQKILEAASYAELLRPIPNALQALKALDAPNPGVEEVQYYPYYYAPPPPPVYAYRRYHHHHNRYYQRYYRGHHHHHHNNYYRRW